MLRTTLLCTTMCSSSAMALAAGNEANSLKTAMPLGPPSHFDELRVGPYELSFSRTNALDGSDMAFEVQRMALRPTSFYLRGLLSEAECDHLIAAADRRQQALPAGDSRSGCTVAWLDAQQDPVVSELAAVVGALLLTPEIRDPGGWGQGGGFENLQVLRYRAGGEFLIHHDANEDTPRTLSLLLYLNGKGETWFPLATADPSLAASADPRLPSVAQDPRSRVAELQACERLVPGRDGLLVAPCKGDAVAFFNFVGDGSGALDRFAFHAGLPAKEEKVVAALWYSLGEGCISAGETERACERVTSCESQRPGR